MNKKFLSVIALTMILAGCAGAPPSTNPALANCDIQRMKRCQGNDPQAPTININTNATKLEASPFCVDADGGSELVFRITPRNVTPLGDAEIIPKDPSHTWLTGKNDEDQNFIYIDVPEGLDTNVRYLYGIKIGDRCTDPRVRVIN